MRALVTGASSGIGRDIARELSLRGYDVVIVARREDKLIELKKELNTKVEIICMDISSQENCLELYKRVGKIDVLINNAGFGVFGNFTETDLYKETQLIHTNIIAVHTLTKLFLKDMKARNEGYILNVASISGFMPGPLMATYYASKAYVVRLTEAIAEELKKENSKVCIGVLCPGPVNTEFNDVANVKFKTKALSSEYVAKYAIEKMLKKKRLIIPGWKMKVVKQLTRFASDEWIANIAYHIQTRKRKEKQENG